MDTFIELISTGDLSSGTASSLTYGSVTSHLTEGEVSRFCSALGQIDATGVWVALDNLNMYMHGRTDLDFSLLAPTLKELVLKVSFQKTHKSRHLVSHHWLESVKKLLAIEDADFALGICKRLIHEICNDDIEYSDRWDYISEAFYRAFEVHGDYLWPKLSGEFIGSDTLRQYRLLDLLGSSRSFNRRERSIFDILDSKTVLEWCKEEEALLIAGRSVSMFISDNDERVFNPLLLKLIAEYGSNEAFTSEISAGFSSRSWVGSLIPYLEADKALIEPLINHENMKVRSWAKLFIDEIDNQIEWESKREDTEKMIGGYD